MLKQFKSRIYDNRIVQFRQNFQFYTDSYQFYKSLEIGKILKANGKLDKEKCMKCWKNLRMNNKQAQHQYRSNLLIVNIIKLSSMRGIKITKKMINNTHLLKTMKLKVKHKK